MKEISIVRENLMTVENYAPYCGNDISRDKLGGCNNPRMRWNNVKQQFVCPKCGDTTDFPIDFIERYMSKWNITKDSIRPNCTRI